MNDNNHFARRIASLLVVDRQGNLLLQLRDNNPAIFAPGKWCIPGGGIEPGEDATAAVIRELREETGLPFENVTFYRRFAFEEEGNLIDENYFYTTTGFTDSDVVVGEGQAIVFVSPEKIPSLDIAEPDRGVVFEFLSSNIYQALYK